MSDTTVVTEVSYKAEMSCSGCSGAITRILTKMDEVDKVDCDLEKQKVVVKAKDGQSLDEEKMLTALQKWGKAAKKEVSVWAD